MHSLLIAEYRNTLKIEYFEKNIERHWLYISSQTSGLLFIYFVNIEKPNMNHKDPIKLLDVAKCVVSSDLYYTHSFIFIRFCELSVAFIISTCRNYMRNNLKGISPVLDSLLAVPSIAGTT